MYKKIWNLINELQLNYNGKTKMFIVVSTVVYSLIGLLIGICLRVDLTWKLCLVGYPGVFGGYVGGIIYLYSHEFE